MDTVIKKSSFTLKDIKSVTTEAKKEIQTAKEKAELL